MSLQFLKIQNFQTHEKLKVEIDPRVTSIIGPSDVGKSAIVRALRWLCLNTPSGDAFVKDGTPGTTIRLKIDDKEVFRRKGKDTNEYGLDDQVFKSFGSSVPEPIEKLLRVSPLNFQSQLDGPLWFNDSAGQVSKNLNSLIDLESIDECIQEINKRCSRAQTEAEVCEKRTREALDKRDSLKWILIAEADHNLLDEKEKALQELRASASTLLATTAAARTHEEQRDKARDLIKPLTLVVTQAEGLNKARLKRTRLNTLVEDAKKQASIKAPDISSLSKTANEVKFRSDKITRLRQLMFSIIQSSNVRAPDLERLNSLQKDIRILEHRKERVTMLIELATKETGRHAEYQLLFQELNKQLKEGWSGVCPTCQRPK